MDRPDLDGVGKCRCDGERPDACGCARARTADDGAAPGPGQRRTAQLSAVQEEARALFERKNADYGDAFASYGPVGVIVRLGDKIRRLMSITKSGVRVVADETLRDTLLDLHNYAAMGVMLLDEKDPGLTG